MNALFDKTQINGMPLKNRFIRSATWENMATREGGLSERLLNVYEELAQGGVGLIISGTVYFSPSISGHIVLASEQARMVVVHDCDIITYSRELLARLAYPVAHPSLGFDFCKGYYARVTDQLNGVVAA